MSASKQMRPSSLKPFRLLDLPTELRKEIVATAVFTDAYLNFEIPPTFPLMHTCRLLRNEAITAYYETNVYIYSLEPHPKDRSRAAENLIKQLGALEICFREVTCVRSQDLVELASIYTKGNNLIVEVYNTVGERALRHVQNVLAEGPAGVKMIRIRDIVRIGDILSYAAVAPRRRAWY